MTFADSLRALADLVEANPLPSRRFPTVPVTIHYHVASAETVTECARTAGVRATGQGRITQATIPAGGIEVVVSHVADPVVP